MKPEILQLYISPGHNFFGHHGREPDKFPAIEVPTLECVTGRGIRGDRFFDYKENYKGQITFFALEVFDQLCDTLAVRDCSTALLRRNVITRGVDLNTLIEQEFEFQGVRFYGTGECKPCYWMDRAIAPGAESFLTGCGGLRARILSDGILHSTVRIAAAAYFPNSCGQRGGCSSSRRRESGGLREWHEQIPHSRPGRDEAARHSVRS